MRIGGSRPDSGTSSSTSSSPVTSGVVGSAACLCLPAAVLEAIWTGIWFWDQSDGRRRKGGPPRPYAHFPSPELRGDPPAELSHRVHISFDQSQEHCFVRNSPWELAFAELDGTSQLISALNENSIVGRSE
jgi:hypothetical protein